MDRSRRKLTDEQIKYIRALAALRDSNGGQKYPAIQIRNSVAPDMAVESIRRVIRGETFGGEYGEKA